MSKMTTMTTTQAARIIRNHYNLDRPVTDQELNAEVQSLIRKHDNGSLDDQSERLYIALRLDD